VPESTASSSLGRARPLIIARSLAAGFSFAVPLVLARTFSPGEYGTYKQFLLVAQTLYYTLPFGVPQSLYYFLPRIPARRPYVVQTLVFLAAAAALCAAVLAALAPRLGVWLNSPELPRYVPALAVYVFGVMCSAPLEMSLTARGSTRLSSAFYFGSELVRSAAMALPAVFGWGLPGVIYGLAGFAALRVVVAWSLVLRGAPGPWFDRAAFAAQLRYALPFGAAVALAIPQQYFHQYVVSARFDASAFAVYAVGMFQLPIIDLLYTPTSEVLMVALGELERTGRAAEGVQVFRAAVAKLAYLFFPATALLVFAAPQFISALFTPRYLEAVPIFRIGVTAAVLSVLPLDGALRARGETPHLFKSYLVKLAVTVPAVLLGIRQLGMVGAVAAWLACEVVGKAMLFARLPRALGAPALALLPWRDLGKALLASLASGAGVATALAVGADWRPLHVLAAAGVLFAAIYLPALYLLGAPAPYPLRWRVHAAARSA
jgi:O-antigen/teichoic acid export membrane protein